MGEYEAESRIDSREQGLHKMKLKHKAALITGGGWGIGRAIALACAEAGADVAVLGRTKSEIDVVAADVSAMGRLGVADRARNRTDRGRLIPVRQSRRGTVARFERQDWGMLGVGHRYTQAEPQTERQVNNDGTSIQTRREESQGLLLRIVV